MRVETRSPTVDAIKVAGIVTIVLIHALRAPWDPGLSPLERWLGHVTRFGVPGFLLASGFLYAKAPKGCGARTFANAEEASQFLIQEQSLICVPWDNAGPFLRFSATYIAHDEAAEDALMAETVRRLGRLELRF